MKFKKTICNWQYTYKNRQMDRKSDCAYTERKNWWKDWNGWYTYNAYIQMYTNVYKLVKMTDIPVYVIQIVKKCV